ncbi:MAG: hypothetical protein KIH08_10070 [Candidatus Freyarchaeota archaeon]|nr:hypothetical protein [Candidatus Jordarchaeia archaeon]MBS7269051.1 hypothetical protein [Candidatus Jordarchaeia archaeon]MBS7278618.1 hypothetical protein [Candidatus Jordarchaeia archaeon]
MKGKLKIFAARALIVLTPGLGTSYLALGPGAFANSNYYCPVGLVYATLEWQVKASAPDLSSSLNFPIDLDIEALTVEQIELYKHSIEDAVNNAFMKWQIQKILSGELKPFTSPPDNESVRNLFFKFLSRNPDCAARFAQYDQMLSRENQLRTPEIVREAIQSLQHVNFIAQQGEIISEVNVTRNINGTNYYIVTRECSLTIDGTIQNITKITVITDDGTIISDPYFRVDQLPLLWPCLVWVWWWPYYVGWWGTVILYGYDYWLHGHWTAGVETTTRLYEVYNNLSYVELSIHDWIGIIPGEIVTLWGLRELIKTGVKVAVSMVVSAIVAVFDAVWPVVLHGYQQAVWANFNNTALYNFAKDPFWGWHECDYFHDPMSPPTYANPPCWDVNDRIVFYIMNIDGGFIEKAPLGQSNVLLVPSNPATTLLWDSYRDLMVQWNLAYGFNQWMWLAPYQPEYPPSQI